MHYIPISLRASIIRPVARGPLPQYRYSRQSSWKYAHYMLRYISVDIEKGRLCYHDTLGDRYRSKQLLLRLVLLLPRLSTSPLIKSAGLAAWGMAYDDRVSWQGRLASQYFRATIFSFAWILLPFPQSQHVAQAPELLCFLTLFSHVMHLVSYAFE